MKSGRPSTQPVWEKCTCASTIPGAIHRPETSVTTAPAGGLAIRSRALDAARADDHDGSRNGRPSAAIHQGRPDEGLDAAVRAGQREQENRPQNHGAYPTAAYGREKVFERNVAI